MTLPLEEFANFITLNMANLAETYAHLLAEKGAGHEAIEAGSRATRGRRLLRAVVAACQAGSAEVLCHLVTGRAGRTSGGEVNSDPSRSQLEIECLSQTLTPVVTSLEAGKFLWQILSEGRAAILQARDGHRSPAAGPPAAGQKRTLAEPERRVRGEQMVREITEKMRAATNLEELVKIAAEELNQRFSADYTLIELGRDRAAQATADHNGHQK